MISFSIIYIVQPQFVMKNPVFECRVNHFLDLVLEELQMLLALILKPL